MIGIIIPALILITSFVLTYFLYRHFAKKI